MRIEEVAAAEPMTEENEQELMRLARRYVAVARLLRQRDDLRAERRRLRGQRNSAVSYARSWLTGELELSAHELLRRLNAEDGV